MLGKRKSSEAEAPTIKKKKSKLKCSVSIALPGSIVLNYQNEILRSYMIGQLARTFSIFNVDEIIIYEESTSQNLQVENRNKRGSKKQDPCFILSNMLRYLETPQYLRSRLFPVSPLFQYVGLIRPTNSPHHLRRTDWQPFREGIVMKETSKYCDGYLIDVGYDSKYAVLPYSETDVKLNPNQRVTVKVKKSKYREFFQSTKNSESFFLPQSSGKKKRKRFDRTKYKSKEIGPEETIAVKRVWDWQEKHPWKSQKLYWGYKVKVVENFSKIFDTKYDLVLGTSDTGVNAATSKFLKAIPSFSNCLMVFGGMKGLEETLIGDPLLTDYPSNLTQKDVDLTQCKLFDHILNFCPHQGSRTIRTEEAIPLCLSMFQVVTNRIIWGEK